MMDVEQIARGAEYFARARALGPAIDAVAAQIEGLRQLPDGLFSALVGQDLFRLVLPHEYGGAELAPLDLLRILEQVGSHDASVAWCLGQNNICAVVPARRPPGDRVGARRAPWMAAIG